MLGARGGIARQAVAGTRADVLSFVTAPLEAPLEITGLLRIADPNRGNGAGSAASRVSALLQANRAALDCRSRASVARPC
jgi:hypothetical protein